VSRLRRRAVTVDVRFLEEAGVVEMVFVGSASAEEIDAGMVAAGTAGAEHLSRRYLVDVREQVSGGTAFDILALGEFLASLPPDVIEREAVLLPLDPAAVEEFQFFETVCRNRGLDVRVFTERDAALAWLTE
jgi:hypothetical protein